MIKVQGDPNQKLLFQMAVTLKIIIFDLPLIKPKCVSGVADFFQFSAVCLQFSAVCIQFSKINGGFQNTFSLYQHGVRNADFQSYCH